MLRADLIERMVAAGVVADVQPQFVLTDSAWVDRRLPAPLLPFAYAWRTLLARGIVCAGGSDSPIELPAPLVGMHAAMRRPAASACAERVFRAAECLTFAQALWMYTSGAAYCAGKEHVFGLLKTGYSADFVVLSPHADVTPLPLSLAASSSSSPLSPSTVNGGVPTPASDPAAAVNMFDAHPERLMECRVEQVWIAGSQRL